ncbi:MAG: diguanylate cyclase, partial [Gammaproteobacteria bacterium]|nr:diguanylate cyclase [Gammaproteobacteria bacterium]
SGLAQRATDVLVANSALRNLFSSLIFTDAQGRVVAAYPDPAFLARDLSEHAWFQDTARALTGRINGPFLGSVYRRPLVNITAPLFDHNNRFIGVVAGTLELDERSFLGRLGNIPVGESGYLVVANREGMVIAHGEEGQIMKRVPDQHALIQSMLRGEEGAGETWRADGLPVLVAYRQINQADWFVAAVLPHREALRPVNRFMVSALLASLAVLVVLLLICGRVFGRLFRPLEVLEDALEDRLAKSSNEPIALQGSAEIRAIAQTFNRVFTERLRTLAELDAERQQQERRLSWEATHDALTGLVNRRAFMAQLVHWLQQVQHEDKQAVLAMVDLDHFK